MQPVLQVKKNRLLMFLKSCMCWSSALSQGFSSDNMTAIKSQCQKIFGRTGKC